MFNLGSEAGDKWNAPSFELLNDELDAEVSKTPLRTHSFFDSFVQFSRHAIPQYCDITGNNILRGENPPHLILENEDRPLTLHPNLVINHGIIVKSTSFEPKVPISCHPLPHLLSRLMYFKPPPLVM